MIVVVINEPRHEKTCFSHSRSLISTFVVRYLDSIMPILAKSKITRRYLISIAEQAGLSLTWPVTTKTSFLVTRLKSATSSYSSFGSQMKFYDGQPFILPHLR